MLKYRLISGTILALLGLALFWEEQWGWNRYPLMLLVVILLGFLASREYLQLLPENERPVKVLLILGVIFSLGSAWITNLTGWGTSFHCAMVVFVITGISGFLWEMSRYQSEVRSSPRVAYLQLGVFYLGMMPSFLGMVRFLPSEIDTGYPTRSAFALLMVVFVPKCGDIGAYFTGKFLTGRVLGRTLFTPKLSPKKTWQGFVGGLLSSIFVAVLINSWGGVFHCPYAPWLFGLTVGLAGVFGDLAESMLKRDSGVKDAAQSIPGFGGVLDVIDSLIFAAPVAYCWFSLVQ